MNNFKKIVKVAWVASLLGIVIWSMSYIIFNNDTGPSVKREPVPEAKTVTTTDEEKETARKELDEYLKLAGKAGLVTSYEFSDTARVIYIGNVWYTQKVDFKKDFLGAVALRLKTITGYHNFKVLDAYSNEKVAEVTAFSGSLEVYR